MELPKYITFDTVLDYARKIIGDKPLDACLKGKPEDYQVNHVINQSKDGKYAVRPLTLTHPYLYYMLVRALCHGKNWESLCKIIRENQVPQITVASLPTVRQANEAFHDSTSILQWWNQFEQASITMALKYRYMLKCDIKDCYGSITCNSILKAFSKNGNLVNISMAKEIIQIIQIIQQGKTVGIPQGSVVYNVIAEVVLSYLDVLLAERIQKAGISEYDIIRYRDDYHIFCNKKEHAERISFILQKLLRANDLKLNEDKTVFTEDIITDSIKPDKRYYIANTPIQNKDWCAFQGLEKHLLFIKEFGDKFPNGGQLYRLLSDFEDHFNKVVVPVESKLLTISLDVPLNEESNEVINVLKEKEPHKHIYYQGIKQDQISAMVSILTDIGARNVKVIHYVLRVISMFLNVANKKLNKELCKLVTQKLGSLPNQDYIQLWLQNLSLCYGSPQEICSYPKPLCQIITGKATKLWDMDIFQKALTKGFPQKSICDKEILKEISPVIDFDKQMGGYGG